MDQRRLIRQWIAFGVLAGLVAFGFTYWIAWLIASAT